MPVTIAPLIDVAGALRRELGEIVDDSTRRRAEYSSDASNYRVVPAVVVFPRSTDEILGTLEIARAHGVPVTSRGGGTSVAGNSIGTGIVMDLSRGFNRILDLDPIARTAIVEPGIVLGALQSAAAPHGLRFGPDPSTWARATIGGMLGNNACGNHSLSFGRTADNVVSLDIVDGTGRRFTAGDDLSVVPGLEQFTRANLGVMRTELGRFGRQVSGYSLEHLAPEKGHNLAKALVGTEGTVGVVLGATLDLVAIPQAPLLVALGYSTMYAAADAVPTILEHHPGAVEGLDRALVDAVRRARGDSAARALPDGAGWLLVELSGEDERETLARAHRLIAASGSLSSAIVPPGPEQRAIWRIREDGAGLAGRTADDRQAWPGFEDAAVPPERLGAYLREFDAMLAEHDVHGIPYGHFGDGCIHVRLDVPLDHDGDALRSLMEDAARLVVSYGGSLSGEHGDGRARSELLSTMYSPAAIEAFGGFKALFDPHNTLNPGIIVDPRPLDVDLRRPAAVPLTLSKNSLAFEHDLGDFTTAVHRCVGVGKCRVDNTDSGGFMCPSFVATGDEKDSTRGRARVLQEMINGSLVKGGWDSPEVHDSLDLCLSCKACASDCPAGVDIAAYKTTVLHERYRGRLRPVSHYVLGWLPRWARLVSPFAGLVNAVLGIRPIQKLVLWGGGMDARRSIPRFAHRRFSARRSVPASGPRPVLLWVDSFSDCFSPEIAEAATTVLDSAGFTTVLPATSACCGLTWITTGQLDGARKRLTGLLDALHPYAAQGMPILGLEPSCTAVLRSDLVELLPDDPRSRVVAASTVTLAELLARDAPEWVPPQVTAELVVQPHCHHHAVMGFGTDRALLDAAGAHTTELSGCCGLAGNFGMEKGHYETSVAVAERSLLPALSGAPDATLLADGFSCRTQADQLAGRDGLHLAQVLAAGLAAEGR